MADVFISYSKTRRAEAAELAGELSDLGYSIWWDTSLLPTGSFVTAIDRELDAAKAVVVIWSPESVTSMWVRSEAGHSDRQNKLVNTHTADLKDPATRIPKPFDQIHSVRIDEIHAIVAALDALGAPQSGGGGPVPPIKPVADSVADADDRLFGEVQKANTAGAYDYYLSELPQGRNVLSARFRLRMLRGSGLAPAPPGSPEEHGPPEERYRAEGRIKVPATIVHAAPDGWFLPGQGKVEWFQDHEYGPEMVVIPAGSFIRGSPEGEAQRRDSEGPQQEVTIAKPFAIGRCAVTRGQFAAFINSAGHKIEGGAFASTWVQVKRRKASWRNPGFDQDDSHPVVCVAWDDAKAYVAWLSSEAGCDYRLPTEAEWEYCCRAGTRTGAACPFWRGPSISVTEANYNANHLYAEIDTKGPWRQETVPSVQFAPNFWGLYQVHGNVWEWCEDVWHESYDDGAPADGLAWLKNGDPRRRVVRGGSWYNDPADIRSASRFGFTSGGRYGDLGFRVARTLIS